MMFRKYTPDDLVEFQPNEFSSPDVARDAFENGRYKKFTLDDNGHVAAMVLFAQTNEKDNIWGGFLMVSDYFKARHAAATRKFIETKITEYKPTELWTVSLADDKLSRWHAFLKLQITGQIDVNGKLCDIWSRTWE